MSLHSPGKAFRAALTKENPLQIVGTINANHALLAQRAGYQAIYLSGGGVAAGSLGLPDLGISTVGELIARNQIELVLGSDAAWKMIRELAEERCFQALREIRNVLDDSGLTDPECFAEIEKNISVLEELGVGCGRRHDF